MKYTVSMLMGLLTAIIVQSQEIQVLPADPAVTYGTLPNGTMYYIVNNPIYKGMADFAVVQKTGVRTVPEEDRGRVAATASQALGPQQRLLSPTVQDFFNVHGVAPGRNGYVDVTDNATVFRFEDMLYAQTGELLDSTLLVLMNIVDRASSSEDAFMKKWYSPSDHAMIISGDVDAGAVVEKLKMLSYMTPTSPSAPRQEYVWQDSGCEVVLVEDSSRDIVTVSALWRLQRTPKDFMNTVQPAIYERFMNGLGIVAKKRIGYELKAAGIPYGQIRYDFVDSTGSLDDEMFEISLSVAPSDMMKAVSVLGSVMSDLDAGNAGVEEVRRADRIYLENLRSEASGLIDNSAYVDKCVAAFLYNSTLASHEEVRSFHSSRAVDDLAELVMFNSIVSASIDPSRNLIVRCSGKLPRTSSEEVMTTFEAAWENAPHTYSAAMPQEPDLWDAGEKLKVKSSKKEHMSGGTIMTMSNGFKVIFMNMPTNDIVHYSLVLNGGYGSVRDLHQGDGAYMSDYLDFCTIGGVDSGTFKDAMLRNGMTMDFRMSMSSVTMKGQVADDGLEYLVRVLLTVLNDRSVDEDAFAEYLACEPLRLEMGRGSALDRMTAVDSIMCPGYRYTSYKAAGRLSSTLAGRADALMDNLAAKMNDAVLVLAGDVDEAELRKVLVMYADGFKVSDRAFMRPVVSYQPISGEVMYTLEGDSSSVDVLMSAPLALTADNYYTAVVASMVLRKSLMRSVAGTGMTLDLVHDFTKYPQERFSIKVSLAEASVEGFAPGTASEEPIDAMNAVRRKLDALDSMDVSDEELSSYKSLLKQTMSNRRSSPDYWLRAVPMRYLDGKDLTTGCDARIDAVDKDKVKGLLKSLADGARVEYIISRK